MSMRHPSSRSSPRVLKCTDLPQFDALLAQADQFDHDDKLHLRNLCNDSARCASLMTVYRASGGRKLVLDYSRQRVTGETMELLFDLGDAVGLTERRQAMRMGYRVNATQDKPALHHVWRMPVDYPLVLQHHHEQQRKTDRHAYWPSREFSSTGDELLHQVHQVRNHVEDFSTRVRSQSYQSVTQKAFVNVICIGGAALMGPRCVAQALQADPVAQPASQGRTLRFLSTVDPVDFELCTHDLDPAETLVLVVSRTFSETETMLIVRTVQDWLVRHLVNHATQDDDVVARHFVAITDNPVRCRQFGISKENTFEFSPWISDRYSLCSVVGILPLSLHYSYPVVCDLLNGAHEMDEHFFDAPLNDNIPVILGVLGVWNSTFLGYTCRAILPYATALEGLSTYLQSMDMSSNGKRVALDGTPLLHRSGEINVGATGTSALYTVFQLMHQGRAIPADFIGFMESQQPVDLPGEAVSNHDELMSHFFAQPDALAYGKTLVDLIQEDVPEPLREHMVCPGNRPSSSLLMTRLDAFAIGQLVALYEHRTAVQGFLWGINSFDRFGDELGKTLARKVRSQLSVSRKTGASVQGFNASTSTLLEHYLAHGKEQQKRQAGTNFG